MHRVCTHVSIVRQNVDFTPLRHHVPHAMRKRTSVRHVLVLQVEYRDFGYIRFAGVGGTSDVVPYGGRGRMSGRCERG